MQTTLQRVVLDDSAVQDALEVPVVTLGDKRDVAGGRVTTFVHSSGCVRKPCLELRLFPKFVTLLE